MRGISLRVIQLLAGHTSYKVTARYAHLSPEVHGQPVRVLNAAFSDRPEATLH